MIALQKVMKQEHLIFFYLTATKQYVTTKTLIPPIVRHLNMKNYQMGLKGRQSLQSTYTPIRCIPQQREEKLFNCPILKLSLVFRSNYGDQKL
ncbi:hypothetical protein CHS0354_003029 [Potamilus streckersoni]|uniref:Uncharacterized protein n=1 Tax=Potamilus streckersoni TaxID=2493646 RepID=A0AAE0RQC5_9BIVA|nr:hypothetical protein CHS0354_003029 [Potamilus streckersoni]